MTVATMTAVSPGSYLVFAKTTLVQTNSGNGTTSGLTDIARCTLNGDRPPTSRQTTTPNRVGSANHEDQGARVGRATLQTEVTLNLAAPGSFTLICRKANTTDVHVARETKIIAVPIDSTTREAVTG